MHKKGCEKTGPFVGAAAAHKEGFMEEQNRLIERINQIVEEATLEELQILLITIREILRK